jgi:hypothetical protein
MWPHWLTKKNASYSFMKIHELFHGCIKSNYKEKNFQDLVENQTTDCKIWGFYCGDIDC